ncbi:hypothetical protein ACFL5K_04780 [Gemmatimonadota bacterium]
MFGRHLGILLLALFLLREPLSAAYCYKGDFTEDGKLNITDVIQFLIIGRDSPEDERLDFNSDGEQDIADAISLLIYIMTGPQLEPVDLTMEIIFLHHSTGSNIWNGGVAQWFDQYNADNGTGYNISELAFPSGNPYPWNNYPYDYWNIWINHAGSEPYNEEPTLEILTGQYDVIVFKHCFPVSGISADTGNPDVTSPTKSIENYKLQYEELKNKTRKYPQIKFIVWTGAALVENATDQASAERAKTFFDWVRSDWDEAGDNIFIWDFYRLETLPQKRIRCIFQRLAPQQHFFRNRGPAVLPENNRCNHRPGG